MKRWTGFRTVFSRKLWGLPAVDVAAAALLSAVVFIAVADGSAKQADGRPIGIAAAFGVLAMVVPVAWRQRWALAAAGTLAAGGMLNGLVFGHIVRCGVALPAAFLVAYALGAHSTNRAWALGLGLLGVNIVSQGVFDPNLGPSMIPILVPLAVGFFAAGRLVLSRARASAALREQSGALRRQREETARMSVLADRARISGDLTESLDNRIAKIQALAASAQGTEATDPRAASDALAAIEDDSRQLMESMRRIVGDLDAAPTDAPSLQELSSLLARATSAQATLTVEGDSRRLPAGIELAAYRIVEHLLLGLEDDSGARIELSVSCRADSVEIHLSGPPALGVEFPALLAAARERAALYRGTLEGLTVGRVREATVRLPLVSGYA